MSRLSSGGQRRSSVVRGRVRVEADRGDQLGDGLRRPHQAGRLHPRHAVAQLGPTADGGQAGDGGHKVKVERGQRGQRDSWTS